MLLDVRNTRVMRATRGVLNKGGRSTRSHLPNSPSVLASGSTPKFHKLGATLDKK